MMLLSAILRDMLNLRSDRLLSLVVAAAKATVIGSLHFELTCKLDTRDVDGCMLRKPHKISTLHKLGGTHAGFLVCASGSAVSAQPICLTRSMSQCV